MIALVLGGASSVWDDLAAAKQLIGSRNNITVAANLAGIHMKGPLDAWATLHPDHLPSWRAQRTAARRNGDARTFTPLQVAERWPGSSGLYAAQVALFEMGAGGAILCGVPMETKAGHFINPGAWASTTDYRRAFELALPVIGGRVRSMDGWTRELFGPPTTAWLEAISTARPLGVSANPARTPMHKVKNTSEGERAFWHTDITTGRRKLARLQPGEEGSFEIDPEHSSIKADGLIVTEVAEPAAPKKAAPKGAVIAASHDA